MKPTAPRTRPRRLALTVIRKPQRKDWEHITPRHRKALLRYHGAHIAPTYELSVRRLDGIGV